MTAPVFRRFIPILLAIGCVAAGAVASVYINKPQGSEPATIANDPLNHPERDQLAAIQEELVNSSVLPTDFRAVPDFSLLDVDGAPIDKSVFSDKWSVVFFGFTHCPDVCPITLTVMKDVVKQLESVDVPQPQTVFVSVDPNRDTPEVMKRYIGYFNPDFLGVTGELNEVHKFTKALGIVTAFTARADDPTQYDVDHTASMLLIDPEQRVRAKLSAPHTADAIVADYTAIVKALASTQAASL